MNCIILKNNTESIQRLMLEPWTHTYDISPGQQVEVRLPEEDGEDPLQIDIEKDNFFSIWAPYGTKVMLDGREMDRI